ncbi:hypothetical protein [Aquitalea magnusonii]|uniref:N-acetylmuramoyl-L-alanine amidase n=1 Tax=Aquitalea magnusonii TaxID=332411 RepID=A0A318JP19_9NEIS|nr:hypothetical protein [Aquitalea magnusonii]PXX45735.1 hypothetical protein DFR38_111132 [Aquitalea magnusonii]
MSRTINLIVTHCAASPNGKVLGSASRTAADFIDQLHAQRGFHHQPTAIPASAMPISGNTPIHHTCLTTTG